MPGRWRTGRDWSGGCPGAPQKPNILLILTDDQDVRSVSRMPTVQSRLVDRGLTFNRSFATTAMCCPARASILRGQYAHNHGVWGNVYPEGGFERFRELGRENSTLATWLDDAGYRTGYMGKYFNEYGTYDNPTIHVPPGWDRWVGYEGYYYHQKTKGAFKVNDQGRVVRVDTDVWNDTDYFARRASAFIKDRTADTPWFLVVAPNAPHGPALASKRNDGTYAGRTMPKTPNFNEANMSDKASIWQKNPRLTSDCPPGYRTEHGLQCIPEVNEVWRDRMESLQDVDDLVGTLVSTLRDEGSMRNTYIVFTSDNGFALYNNRIYSKGAPYEDAQGVPLIIRGPGVRSGYVDRSHLVANIDLAPTFAKLARLSIPDFVDGRSLVPILNNTSDVWRTRLLFEHRLGKHHYNAIRTNTNQVYIEYPLTSETEYYNLTDDPYQLDGKVEIPPSALKAQLQDLLSCAGVHCREADRPLRTKVISSPLSVPYE